MKQGPDADIKKINKIDIVLSCYEDKEPLYSTILFMKNLFKGKFRLDVFFVVIHVFVM